jgi:hypothetical protein
MASTRIEQALQVYLRSKSGVTYYLGQRIYWIQAPQDTVKPYCVFFVISDTGAAMYFDHIQAGQPRVQFSVFDADKYTARDAADALRDELQFYSGTMDGMAVERITCTRPANGPRSDQELYHIMFDAHVEYWE